MAMELIDVHAHMADEGFVGDLDQVLESAARVGVVAIITVVENVAEGARLLDLAERYPILKPCAGLYPDILDLKAAAEMEAFIRNHQDRLVGIGEVGLDHWVVKDEEQRRRQEEILARFVALATELDLPLNVHSRSAGRHTIRLLQAHGATRVLMHAFDGRASTALEGIEAGFYFSIPPSIVRSQQKQKLLRHLPLERLLLETDSPVLGPDRLVRNEPKNVLLSCQAVTQAKGVSVGEVARVTTENARQLFPKAFALPARPHWEDRGERSSHGSAESLPQGDDGEAGVSA
ncbi:MAG: TatD family hydrolase [Candidatus Methylomirabilales bacterium]